MCLELFCGSLYLTHSSRCRMLMVRNEKAWVLIPKAGVIIGFRRGKVASAPPNVEQGIFLGN